ncbi:MAG: glutaminyl-peptide cyclotransferase, partial [Balneolaceae bacterium]
MNKLAEPTRTRRARHGIRLCLVVLMLIMGPGRVDPIRAQSAGSPEILTYGYRVIESYPHDPDAFTQGLLVADGDLYESTGRLGESSLRRVELESGKVKQIHHLAEDLFGEGLARWEDRLIQITYRAGLGFVYDRESFREIRRFRYTGEGWGLTSSDTHLILSDGSASLRFLDPVSFEVVQTVVVTEQGEPVDLLNELEMVGDRLFANVL